MQNQDDRIVFTDGYVLGYPMFGGNVKLLLDVLYCTVVAWWLYETLTNRSLGGSFHSNLFLSSKKELHKLKVHR